MLKRVFYQFAYKDTDKILKRISRKTVVSFDVFDTLLKREVNTPKDVFAYMEKELRKVDSISMEHFAEKRIKAEQAAREAHPKMEVSLREIYDRLPYDDSVKQEIMTLEVQTEFKLSKVNYPIKKVYDRCVEQKKQIYFISDMYLSKEVVDNLLRKSGYTKGKLYVSSESGFTKRSGKLFHYIQRQEKLDVHEWVHIGDSILADFIVPRCLGIRTLLIDREMLIDLHKCYKVDEIRNDSQTS